eukprot:15357317-Ditylum_brightwellii.AAC.1
MDNEVSADIKTALTNYKKTFELTLPNMHWQNITGRAIHAFKNHFIAGLATCSTHYLITAWGYLIE